MRDTRVFLGREFLINREVPSSAYLQRANVAVDADWQQPSRDGLEVMCRSAYPFGDAGRRLLAYIPRVNKTPPQSSVRHRLKLARKGRERSKAVTITIQDHSLLDSQEVITKT